MTRSRDYTQEEIQAFLDDELDSGARATFRPILPETSPQLLLCWLSGFLRLSLSTILSFPGITVLPAHGFIALLGRTRSIRRMPKGRLNCPQSARTPYGTGGFTMLFRRCLRRSHPGVGIGRNIPID